MKTVNTFLDKLVGDRSHGASHRNNATIFTDSEFYFGR